MPRFGKKFKMFEKIVPSLELDITDLLSEGGLAAYPGTETIEHKQRRQVMLLSGVSGPQECILCGKLAEEECTDCFKEPVFSSAGFKFFCKTCSAQVLLPSGGCPVATFKALLMESSLQGFR